MGGKSSSPQITTLELIAKAVPYKDLRQGVELLVEQITPLRNLLDLIDLVESHELVNQANEIFVRAYSVTYIYKIHQFYDAKKEFGQDCATFNEAIICIKTELEKIAELQIRKLKKSDPNVAIIKEHLKTISKKGNCIVMTVNLRLREMGVP